MSCGDIFLALLAVLFPPLAVWIKRGLCSADSLINLCLCVLGVVPGLLHAWYIIATYPEEYEPIPGEDIEANAANNNNGGRANSRDGVTYFYVSPPGQGGGSRADGQTQTSASQQQQPPVSPGGVGAPDGGRAHRQLQRMGSYGAMAQQQHQHHHQPGERSRSVHRQGVPAAGEGSEGLAKPPPTYEDAIKGDHKTQAP